MSATLVEYPRKPNELADDIESFVYVITLAILRFHRTSLEDKTLSAHVSMTYHNALRTTDGHDIGSGFKLNNIRAGDPGFELPELDSSLAILLHALWKLGQEHYATLDYQDLRSRWGVKRARESEARGPSFQLGILRLPRGKKTILTKTSSTVVSPLRQVSAGLRDFRSHSHILDIFEGFYEGEWVPAPKVGDLFENLNPFVEVSSATGSSQSSDSERTLEDDSSSDERESKRRRISSCSV